MNLFKVMAIAGCTAMMTAALLPVVQTTPLPGLFALLTIAGALGLFVSGKRFYRSLLEANFFAFLLCTSLFLFVVPSGLRAQSTRAPVNLGTAGNYVILSETGITDVSPSPVTGNIGASPITGAAIHVTCAEMKGGVRYPRWTPLDRRAP